MVLCGACARQNTTSSCSMKGDRYACALASLPVHTCPECNLPGSTGNLESVIRHMEHECPQAIVKCPTSGCTWSGWRCELNAVHLPQCVFVVVPCDTCGVNTTRQKPHTLHTCLQNVMDAGDHNGEEIKALLKRMRTTPQ